MRKTISRICLDITGALLLIIMTITTVTPTSEGGLYPSPQNNPSMASVATIIPEEKTKAKYDTVDNRTRAKNTTKTITETEPVAEETEPELIMYFDEADVLAMARTMWNECRGVSSKTEQACVAWTACNRVGKQNWGDKIIDVLTYPGAFAHSWSAPVDEDLYDLALDVLTRWNYERNGYTNVGRVLPEDYIYFRGDGKHNYFRNTFDGNFQTWDYSLPSPYEN